MKAILKKITASIVTAVLMLLPATVVIPSVAHAEIADNVCRGVLDTGAGDPSSGGSGTTADDCTEEGDQTFASLAKKIINVFSIVVGAVSVIMIIIGGFRYIISGGDSNAVTGGKNTILYAIVGLVIVLFAQVIVRFVITNITQASG